MSRRRVRTASVTTIISAIALTVAACGSPEDDEVSESETDGETTGHDEVLEISMAALPIVATAGLQYGLDAGIFEEHGIDLTLDGGIGSEIMVASLLGGEVDFITFNTVASMVALDADMPIQITSGFSHAQPEGAEADVSAVLAMPDSGIESAADLEDATIAVNTFNSGGTLSVREAVRQDGGDPEAVSMAEIPFPEALPTLERGDVDAIWVVEPFITFAQNAGAEVVSWNFAETAPSISTQIVATTEDQDPAVIERLTAALDETFEAGNEDPEGLNQALMNVLDMDEELASVITQEHYSTAIDGDALATFAELALDDGIVDEPVDLSAYGVGGE